MSELPSWERFTARAASEPVVIFINVGKLMAEERFYRPPLVALSCLVDTLHVDEAAQFLDFNGKHMLRVLKPKYGGIVLTSDPA